MHKLRERAGPILKITCLILAVLVICQLAGIFIRWNPFRGVSVPALPSLTAGTNNPAVAPMTGANANLILPKMTADKGTNFLIPTNAAGTNLALHPKMEKNFASAAPVPEMAGMNFNPFAPSRKRGTELPPAVQSKISRITDSEILGPVMHPLPMALLGIAGEFAFIRSDTGQTGLVKEGDSLDDIKLLRIGINRVLIEQDGQKQELTIFSGYGGESLLPKGDSQ